MRMTESMGFTDRLGVLIDACGSQKRLAKAGGIGEQTLINWRRGLGMRDRTIEDFARRLGISLEWLIHGNGDKKEEFQRARQRCEDYFTSLSSRTVIAEEPPPYGGKNTPAKIPNTPSGRGARAHDSAPPMKVIDDIVSALSEPLHPRDLEAMRDAIMNATSIPPDVRLHTANRIQHQIRLRRAVKQPATGN